MRANTAKQQLKAGQPSIGTWLSLPDPIGAEYLAQCGFDWLCVDLEHNPINLETATLMYGGISRHTVPITRIPWNTGENIKRVLDCGAWGIVVPMVNSRAEAEAAVAAAKYPPQGVRSVGGSRHALGFETDSATYYARANDEVLVILQIEHIRGVEAAGDILAVPGVDAVFIGPNDLMASMGMQPQGESDDRRVVEAIDHVRQTALACGVAPGIHCYSPESINRRIEQGFRFLALGSELRLLQQAAREQLSRITRPRATPAGPQSASY